jgi:SpoVK/Ycf46/Vps4 family AAA+-type ATPase
MPSEEHDLIAAIEAAVAVDESNVVLRTHLARLLIDAGRPAEALNHASRVLITAPDDAAALAVMAEATAALRPGTQPANASPEPPAVPAADVVPDTADELFDQWADNEPLTEIGVDGPMTPGVRLADIGGMEQVKQRIHASFLDPLRNPEIAARFGKTMRGGLLLWGPPGCGKTFIARALAGELGASFYVIGLNDVLEMWIGKSERNLHEVFERARRNKPCVLFFDELDSIGQRRANLRTTGATFRNVVNLFLAELDGADVDNDGVFVLGATNHPWDVDSALMRPGRFDRTVLVLPPDRDAREAILRLHLRGRPVEKFDLRRIADASDGFSGADLSLVCEQATERAMADSIRSGQVRPISQADLVDAVRTVQPSIGPWMETARNFATYSNDSGMYDELVDFLKRGSTSRWRLGGR